MGHAPEDKIGEDGNLNPNGEEAVEPKGIRWPGGVFDLSAETFNMDDMRVSPAFLELHASLSEDLSLVANQIGATNAKTVTTMILTMMIQEMRQTVIEAKDAAPDGQMAIGRGGLQQVLVDLTFFHQNADDLADMTIYTETLKVMEYIKLQAEVVLGAGCVANETGGDWYDEYLAGVVMKSEVMTLAAVLDEDEV